MDTEVKASAVPDKDKGAAESCANCRFARFVPTDGRPGSLPDFNVRECHRHSINLFCTVMPGPKGQAIPVFNTAFPRLESWQWCGEWEGKK